MSKKIAFNTANLVAEHTGWRFSLSDWGKQDALTVEKTTDAHFAAMCRRISEAGFRAVELWRAHVDPARVSDARGQTLRGILAEHGLEPVALAGPLTEETARICRLLDIPRCCGGLWGTDAATVKRVSEETGIAFCYENHPEKSVQEIRQCLPQGSGVALDLGWLGTQGLNAPAVVRELGELIHHVHLKDVRASGGHETMPLGEGCVDVAGAIAALKQLGYSGWHSWEDEPENRNPYDIAREMREWIERELGD